MAKMFRTKRKLAADSLSIVFVTSDMEELMALSDSIIVISNGRVTATFDRKDASETRRNCRLGQGPRAHQGTCSLNHAAATPAPQSGPANPLLVLYGINTGLGWSIQFNTVEICLIVMLVSVLIGAVNGFLITKLNVSPFITPLGTLYVFRGAAFVPTPSL